MLFRPLIVPLLLWCVCDLPWAASQISAHLVGRVGHELSAAALPVLNGRENSPPVLCVQYPPVCVAQAGFYTSQGQGAVGTNSQRVGSHLPAEELLCCFGSLAFRGLAASWHFSSQGLSNPLSRPFPQLILLPMGSLVGYEEVCGGSASYWQRKQQISSFLQ